MPEQLQAILAENFRPILFGALRVLMILGGAFAVNRLFRRGLHRTWLYFIQNTQRPGGHSTDPEFEKQAATIAGVLQRTTTVLIYVLALVMALRELGFDVAPLLAGAGVASIAIGFGAQNLVRDVISGIFLLSENQIRVNDVVVINDTAGLVEEINLRTTVLRDGEGTVHVFPNGAIAKLANRTQGHSFYMFDLNLSYRDDPDRAIAILRETGERLAAEAPYSASILAPIEIFGVDKLGETHVVVKGRIKTRPGKQWEVGREINRRLKQRFDAEGFDLPARAPRHLEATLNPGLGIVSEETVRAIVRDVLAETKVLDVKAGKQEPS